MLLAFVWALAEATVWPIMPDALLVPLVARRPRSWWRLVVGAALGTLVGGTVSYCIGRSRPDEAAVVALPLVRRPMVQAAARWLTCAGARGVLRQPPSGVPYKVFARLAGSQGIALGPFLGWTLAARGGRFLFSVSGAMVARWLFPAIGGRWYLQATAIWCVAFGVGLWRTVLAWEAALPPSGAAAGARQISAFGLTRRQRGAPRRETPTRTSHRPVAEAMGVTARRSFIVVWALECS